MTTTFLANAPEHLVSHQVTNEQDFDTETIEFLQHPTDKPLQIYARPEIRKGCAWDIQLKISPDTIKKHNLRQIYLEKPRGGRNLPYLYLKVRSKLIKPIRELALTKVATILHEEESIGFNEYSALTLKVRFTARPRAVFHKHSDMMILLAEVKIGEETICLDEFELIFRGGTGSVHSADSRKAAAVREPPPASVPNSQPMFRPSMLPQVGHKQNMMYPNQQMQYLPCKQPQQMAPQQIQYSLSQPPLYHQLCQQSQVSYPVAPRIEQVISESPASQLEERLSWSFFPEFEEKTSLMEKTDPFPQQSLEDLMMNSGISSGPWSPSEQFVDDVVFPSFSASPPEDQEMKPDCFSEDSLRRESSEEQSTTHDEADVLMEVCEDLKECFLLHRASAQIPSIPNRSTLVHGKRRGMCVDCQRECECYVGAGGPCSECGCFPSAHLDLDCEVEYNKKRLLESTDSRPAKKARFLIKYYQQRAQSHKS